MIMPILWYWTKRLHLSTVLLRQTLVLEPNVHRAEATTQEPHTSRAQPPTNTVFHTPLIMTKRAPQSRTHPPNKYCTHMSKRRHPLRTSYCTVNTSRTTPINSTQSPHPSEILYDRSVNKVSYGTIPTSSRRCHPITIKTVKQRSHPVQKDTR